MGREKQACSCCGTTIYYSGLCWRCGVETARAEILTFNDAEIVEKVNFIKEHLLSDDGKSADKALDMLDKLISYKGMLFPEFAELLYKNFDKIEYPQLYTHVYTGADDKLCAEIMKELIAQTDDSSRAAELMCVLAMANWKMDKPAILSTFNDLEANPRPWRTKLHVDPSIYAEHGGWSFDKSGDAFPVVYHDCYVLEKRDSIDTAVHVGVRTGEICSKCGSEIFEILVIDGSDDRLKFLGINGTIKAKTCVNCVAYNDIYNRYELNGESEILPYESKWENYYKNKDYECIASNGLVLSKKSVPPFFGYRDETACTIGGYGSWVQDWEYRTCPCCGKKMKYFAQLHWSVLTEGEGTLYLEICHDCKMIVMFHQQT